MKNKIILLLFLISAIGYVSLPSAYLSQVLADTSGINLHNQLNQLISTEPQLNGALIGISVRSGQTGELLYDHNGNIRLTPASNLKLFTAATALEVLGPNHRFTTEVLMDGKVVNGILKGNLYLKGGGDPTLHYSDLQSFAATMKKNDIHTIHGNVIGDNSRYDDVRYSIDMPWSDEEMYYGAEISALTLSPNDDFDAGTVMIEIRPGKTIGESTTYKILPENRYIKIINQSKTGTKEDKKDLTLTRQHGTNRITISGVLPIVSKVEREWVAVFNTSCFTLSLFTDALKNRGITIKGRTLMGETPTTSTKVVSHKSIPLSKLLIPFMKQSNNGHAEILVKELGQRVYRKGSFGMGLQVINQTLPLFQVDPSRQVIRDGSGISHVNAIRPNDVSMLLYHIRKRSWFPYYYSSLPLAGSSEKDVGGTLRNRLKKPITAGKIRAKTGTLTTVSSLSGYVETKTKGTLVFSIIINHVVEEKSAKQIEDHLLEVLTNQ